MKKSVVTKGKREKERLCKRMRKEMIVNRYVFVYLVWGGGVSL